MSLKKDLFSGVFYTAVARYSGLIVSLVIAGVLARLIPPEDFGVVAVATVIISFFGIFTKNEEHHIPQLCCTRRNVSVSWLCGIWSFRSEAERFRS